MHGRYGRRFRAGRPRRCPGHQKPATVGALSGSFQRQSALRHLPTIPTTVVVQGGCRENQPEWLVQPLLREVKAARSAHFLTLDGWYPLGPPKGAVNVGEKRRRLSPRSVLRVTRI